MSRAVAPRLAAGRVARERRTLVLLMLLGSGLLLGLSLWTSEKRLLAGFSSALALLLPPRNDMSRSSSSSSSSLSSAAAEGAAAGVSACLPNASFDCAICLRAFRSYGSSSDSRSMESEGRFFLVAGGMSRAALVALWRGACDYGWRAGAAG